MFLYCCSILGSEEASQADLKKQSSIIVNFWHKSLCDGKCQTDWKTNLTEGKDEELNNKPSVPDENMKQMQKVSVYRAPIKLGETTEK